MSYMRSFTSPMLNKLRSFVDANGRELFAFAFSNLNIGKRRLGKSLDFAVGDQSGCPMLNDFQATGGGDGCLSPIERGMREDDWRW